MAAKTTEIAIVKEVPKLIEEANKLEIKDSKSMTYATEILSTMNKKLDALEEDRKKITAPIKASIKEIESRYKPAETMLDDAILKVRKGMSAYQTEQKRIADEETDRIAARVGEGKGKLKAETAMNKIEEIDRPDAHVSTDAGSVKFRTDQKFEILDISKIPFDYLVPNETKIRTAMKAGVKLTGIRYYTKETPINSR